MAKHSLDDWIGAPVGITIVLPIMGSIGVGILTILWQCLNWLKLAEWQTLTLRDGFSWWIGSSARDYAPRTGYLGLDRILLGVLDGSPLALWLIVIAPAIWLIVGFMFYGMLASVVARARAGGRPL